MVAAWVSTKQNTAKKLEGEGLDDASRRIELRSGHHVGLLGLPLSRRDGGYFYLPVGS